MARTTGGLVLGAVAVLVAIAGCTSPEAAALPTSMPATRGNPFPQDVSFTAIEITVDDTGNDHTVFLGTERGQIWKGKDGGQAWAKLELPEPGAVLDIAIPSGLASDELFAGTASGLFRSTDGGGTWAGLEKDRFKRAWTVSLSPNYAKDGRIAIVAAGVNFGDSALVSSDRGQTWEPGPEPASRDIQFLSDGRLAGAINVRAWVESPPGQHLGVTTAAAEHTSVSRATFSPDFARDGIVFYGGAYTSKVHRTGNDTPAPEEFDFYLGHRGMWCEEVDDTWGGYGSSPNCFIPVAVSPGFDVDGFAAAASYEGLFLTRDHGRTWRKTRLLVPTWEAVRAAAISPSFDTDSAVAVITAKRVLVSTDGGQSWSPRPSISQSPPDANPAQMSSELLRDVRATLRAEPVPESPRTFRFVANIEGGPDGNEELYCLGLFLDFGDGTAVKVADKCGPEPTFLRQFEQLHIYEAPGRYEAMLFFGPLFAYTAVEVGN